MTPKARIAALAVAVSGGLSCGFETRGLVAPSREVDVSQADSATPHAAHGGAGVSGSNAAGASGASGSNPSTGISGARAVTKAPPTDAGVDAQAAQADAASDAPDAANAQPPEDAGVEPCPPTRETVVVDATIVVGPRKTFDGECKRYTPGAALRSAAVAMPDQSPMFQLEAGARMQNALIDSTGVDAVHTLGDATLANVTWERVGDEAVAINGEGTIAIEGGSAAHGPNAMFVINASATLRVVRFRASDANKLIRQNGGTMYRAVVTIERCDVSAMTESIFRTDNSVSRVTMTNTRYSRIGGQLFEGVSPQNVLMSGNREY